MSILERIRTWHTGRVERRRVIEEQCAAIDQEERRSWVAGEDYVELTPEQLDRILSAVILEAQADARRRRLA
jgi:hypothetical protein